MKKWNLILLIMIFLQSVNAGEITPSLIYKNKGRLAPVYLSVGSNVLLVEKLGNKIVKLSRDHGKNFEDINTDLAGINSVSFNENGDVGFCYNYGNSVGYLNIDQPLDIKVIDFKESDHSCLDIDISGDFIFASSPSSRSIIKIKIARKLKVEKFIKKISGPFKIKIVYDNIFTLNGSVVPAATARPYAVDIDSEFVLIGDKSNTRLKKNHLQRIRYLPNINKVFYIDPLNKQIIGFNAVNPSEYKVKTIKTTLNYPLDIREYNNCNIILGHSKDKQSQAVEILGNNFSDIVKIKRGKYLSIDVTPSGELIGVNRRGIFHLLDLNTKDCSF